MDKKSIEFTEPAGCDGLVTFTLLANAEDFIQHRELSLKCLFDLSTLVDSIMLHPRLVAIRGVLPDERYPHQVVSFLTENRLIYFYQPSYSTRELVTMINQYSLFRNLEWWGGPHWDHLMSQDKKKAIFQSTQLADECFCKGWQPESKRILEASTVARFDDTQIESLINEIRANKASFKLKGLPVIDLPEDWNLFDIIHVMSTGHHKTFREYLFRTVVYLCSADYDRVTFYPDYVRIPYISSCANRLYSNLSSQVYQHISAAFDAKVEEILEDVPGTHLTLPPFTYMVLEEMVKGASFFEALLDVRVKFEGMRQKLGGIDGRIRNALTLKEKKKALSQKKELLAATTKSYGSGQGSRYKEFLSFAKDLARAGAAPLDPTAYNERLLKMPYQWIRDWWLRRPVAHLLDAMQRLERVPEVLDLFQKAFSYEISLEEITSYKESKNSVAGLMRRYEASEP